MAMLVLFQLTHQNGPVLSSLQLLGKREHVLNEGAKLTYKPSLDGVVAMVHAKRSNKQACVLTIAWGLSVGNDVLVLVHSLRM
eukprot:6342651-Amphidinium_carterae.2